MVIFIFLSQPLNFIRTISATRKIGVKHSLKALVIKNYSIENTRNNSNKYTRESLSNEDTFKQLLIKSRCFYYRPSNKWIGNQFKRTTTLFERYPYL